MSTMDDGHDAWCEALPRVHTEPMTPEAQAAVRRRLRQWARRDLVAVWALRGVVALLAAVFLGVLMLGAALGDLIGIVMIAALIIPGIVGSLLETVLNRFWLGRLLFATAGLGAIVLIHLDQLKTGAPLHGTATGALLFVILGGSVAFVLRSVGARTRLRALRAASETGELMVLRFAADQPAPDAKTSSLEVLMPGELVLRRDRAEVTRAELAEIRFTTCAAPSSGEEVASNVEAADFLVTRREMSNEEREELRLAASQRARRSVLRALGSAYMALWLLRIVEWTLGSGGTYPSPLSLFLATAVALGA